MGVLRIFAQRILHTMCSRLLQLDWSPSCDIQGVPHAEGPSWRNWLGGALLIHWFYLHEGCRPIRKSCERQEGMRFSVSYGWPCPSLIFLYFCHHCLYSTTLSNH